MANLLSARIGIAVVVYGTIFSYLNGTGVRRIWLSIGKQVASVAFERHGQQHISSATADSSGATESASTDILSPPTEPAYIVVPAVPAHVAEPKLELFLPLFHKKEHLYRLMERTLLLFWPTARLLLVMDDEKDADHLLAKQILEQATIASRKGPDPDHFPHVRVAFQSPVAATGHDRQQLRMFEADLFTNASFVGFIDTDSYFVTRVTEENLFDNGKPVIIAEVGQPQNRFWENVPRSTMSILGFPERMRCMSHFPIIVKVAHINEMRRDLESRHNSSMQKLLQRYAYGRPWSQFNIMCNWLYQYKRDEYKFQLHEVTHGWRNKVAGQISGNDYANFLLSHARVPVVRVAQHGRYDELNSPRDIAKAMARGYCLSAAGSIPSHCRSMVLQTSLFVFEGRSWLWNRTGCAMAQRSHYDKIWRDSVYFNKVVLRWIANQTDLSCGQFFVRVNSTCCEDCPTGTP